MKKIFLLLFILVSMVGCSHELRITNADKYYVPPTGPLANPLKLGVSSPDLNHREKGKYITAIYEGFQTSGSFSKVIYPYIAKESNAELDMIIDIEVVAKYSGKDHNFWITWPGFFIFAPAFWGFGYTADITCDVKIKYLKDNRLQQLTIPVHYEFRQAEIDRTWTEAGGWFFWTVPAFIGGFFFTDFDPDVTEPFINNVSKDFGKYVAKKIIDSFPVEEKPSIKETLPQTNTTSPAVQTVVPGTPNANTTIQPQVPVNPAIPGTVTQPVPSKTVTQPPSVQPQPKPVN